MKRLAPKLARIATIATAETESFVALAKLAGLDPARAFRGADLRNVDFGTDDIAGFNFSRARLEGADISQTKNYEKALFTNAITDPATRWPGPPLQPIYLSGSINLSGSGAMTATISTAAPSPIPAPPQHEPDFEDADWFTMMAAAPPVDFSIDEVQRRILAGEPIPPAWLPFVRKLNFSVGVSHSVNGDGIRMARQRVWPDTSEDVLQSAAPLADLYNLSSLNITGTSIFDLSPMVGLLNLRTLNLMATKVSGINLLAGLKKLESLNLECTQVSDLSPLSGLAALKHLNVRNTAVHELQGLCGLDDLQAFYLFRTASIPGRLPKFEGRFRRLDGSVATNDLQYLVELDISGTKVRDLSPLLTLPSLARLDISRTMVVDLKYLNDLKNLEELIISGLPAGIESTLPRRAEIKIIRG